MSKKTYTIRMDVDLHKEIKLYCIEHNYTIGDFLSLAAHQHIKTAEASNNESKK